VHDSDVVKAVRIVTAAARRHMSAGVVAQAFGLLPADLRGLLEPAGTGPAAARASAAGSAATGGR